MTKAQRHLAGEIVAGHLAGRVPVSYPYPGSPPVELLIDGSANELRLRCPDGQLELKEVDRLEHLSVARAIVGGNKTIELCIRGEPLLADGHAMFCAIADRIQLDGLTSNEAIRDTLAKWHAVLASRSRLSREEEIGLFGELLVLRGLLGSIGDSAIANWKAPDAEEHDFEFGTVDVEVKTTTNERRLHWISTVTQLRANPGRELRLVSLQVTGAGDGGQRLGELVDDVRKLASSDELDRKLVLAGWSNHARDLYVDRWRIRSTPREFEVKPGFPAVTPEILESVGPEFSRVVAMKYQLDLESTDGSVTPLDALTKVLNAIGEGE